MALANEPTSFAGLPAGVQVRMVGETVCGPELLKGHDTYVGYSESPETGKQEPAIIAAASGVVEVTDRVVSVRSLSSRYVAEVGDVVVGRITDVLAGRWLADVGATQHASMLLSNVTEPGGMLRRRGRDDELSMRRIFAEGDAFAAEVQRVTPDGFVSLHTRSANKYGRLRGDGMCASVQPALVRRARHAFHAFPFGVTAIFGVNGRIWVQRTTAESLAGMQPVRQPRLGVVDETVAGAEAAEASGDAAPAAGSSGDEAYVIEDDVDARIAIARTINCLNVLSRVGMSIETATIGAAVRWSEARHLKPSQILSGEHDVAIAAAARAARD